MHGVLCTDMRYTIDFVRHYFTCVHHNISELGNKRLKTTYPRRIDKRPSGVGRVLFSFLVLV